MLTTDLQAVALKDSDDNTIGGAIICREEKRLPTILPFVFHGLDEAEAFVSCAEREGVDFTTSTGYFEMKDRVAMWRDARKRVPSVSE
jgi:hypothetical protein